jgi:CBS domain-containing protein
MYSPSRHIARRKVATNFPSFDIMVAGQGFRALGRWSESMLHCPAPQLATLERSFLMDERTVFQSLSRRHVTSLGPGATVYEAACVMTRANCGSVLIIDTAGALLGILTERDLMTRVLAKALDPAKTAVPEVMTPNPRCVGPDMSVSDAVLIMIERGFRHLPVMAGDGKLLGVFSVRDALPREIDTAVSLAEFHEQVNDALG